MYQVLKNSSVELLLSLRVALDDPQPYLDLEQDIQDLYLYPERLTYSYPDEWRAYIRQQLLKRCISDEALQQYLSYQDNTSLKACSTSQQQNSERLSVDLIKGLEFESLSDEAAILVSLMVDSADRVIAYQHVLAQIKSIQASSKVLPLVTPLQKDLQKLLK